MSVKRPSAGCDTGARSAPRRPARPGSSRVPSSSRVPFRTSASSQPVAVDVDQGDAGAVGLDDEPLPLDAAVDGRRGRGRPRLRRRRSVTGQSVGGTAPAPVPQARGQSTRRTSQHVSCGRCGAGISVLSSLQPSTASVELLLGLVGLAPEPLQDLAVAGIARTCCSGRTRRRAAACLRRWPACPSRDTPGRGRCRGR